MIPCLGFSCYLLVHPPPPGGVEGGRKRRPRRRRRREAGEGDYKEEAWEEDGDETCFPAPTDLRERVNMDIGALPRRRRPISLTVSGPLKSRTKDNSGARVPYFPFAHERQCESLGFMDRPNQAHMTRAALGK